MIVKPFRGLRPRRDLASRIPSPPYDVLDSDEARKLAAEDPYTFLHVIKPEIDLDPGIDPYDERVYDRGRASLRAMVENRWLVRDERPAYYVYRLATTDHVQTGIVGAAAVDDYLKNRIKRHELTREDKERDRTRHMEALSANPGPVFMSYRDSADLDGLAARVAESDPAADFEDPTSVRHTLWVVDDPAIRDRIEEAFAAVPVSYIADGHHRAASAARVAANRRANNPDHTGREAYNYFLTVHFPADQVRILDYNRVIRDLGQLDAGGLLSRLR
ncbi:MAG: DUF1015 domain-containing protein, partial [Acidobacteriota bacterium]|nr:DUF1015 domain-containing protein [Acidobacteriota bacterium]